MRKKEGKERRKERMKEGKIQEPMRENGKRKKEKYYEE